VRSLSSTLLAAQRGAFRAPYVECRLDDYWGDRPRLRFARYYTGSEPESAVAAVVAGDGSLVRARQTGGHVYVSRVANPGPGSTYSSWTDLGLIAAAGTGVALWRHPDVNVLSLAWVDVSDGKSIKFVQSADNGASWGGALAGPVGVGAVTYLAAAANGFGDTVLFWNEGATVYRARANAGSGFGPRTAWTNTIGSCAGLAVEFQQDWQVVVCGTASGSGDAKVWSCVYGDGFDQASNTWSALAEVITAAAGSGVSYRSPATEYLLSFRAFFVEKYTGSGAYARVHWTGLKSGGSFKGELWSEPEAFEVEGDYGVAVAASGSGLWVVTASGVWFAPAPAAAWDASADVMEAELVEVVGGAVARVVLENTSGRYSDGGAEADSVRLGTRMALSWGLRTSAGAEVSAGPRYWVTGVKRYYLRDGRAVVEVEARDGWLLLEGWRARRQFQWAAGSKSVAQLVEYICARAGLDFTGGSSSAFLNLKPAFTVDPGESGAVAVRRLLEKVAERVVMRGGTARAVEVRSDDTAVYEYGTGHAVLRAVYGERPKWWTRVRVFGAGVFGEAFDFEGTAEGGERVRNVGDVALTTTGEASARAAAELRAGEVRDEGTRVVVPVNCGQEVLDVVAVTDDIAGLDGEGMRVLGLRWRFRPERGIYDQELVLGPV
jgi:hypothetical protein